MKEKDTFDENTPLHEMVLSVFDKLVRYLEEEYLPDFWSFRKPYSEHIDDVKEKDMTSYGQPNVLAGSKQDIKHCLQVARLLKLVNPTTQKSD